MNGSEKLWWVQKPNGDVYLTSPESPVPPGCDRYSTTTPSEMDRIFRKLNAQTKEEHGRLTEALYLQRKDRIEQWRKDIRTRMQSSDCSAMEKAFLQAALRANDKREDKLNRNTVYGISAMQTTEEKLPPRSQRLLITPAEDAADKLKASTPVTEAVQ